MAKGRTGKRGGAAGPDAGIVELAREALARGIPFRFRALGGSMFPFIPGGTEVTVERFDRFPPPPGTVCVAARGGRLVCHRLVGAAGGGAGGVRFVLRGDGRPVPDEPPYEGRELIGRVTAMRVGPWELRADALPLRAAALLMTRAPGPARRAVVAAARAARPAAGPLLRLLGGVLRLAGHRDEDD